MPWHDMSDGGVLALVHQEDGRHLHSAPHRSPDWASERWWLREDGFEFPGARQLGNRPIRPRAAPTSKVRKTLDTTSWTSRAWAAPTACGCASAIVGQKRRCLPAI